MTEGKTAAGSDRAGVSAQELERERLTTYLDWAETEVPSWWLAGYAAAVGLCIASYDLSRGWRTVSAMVFVLAMVLLLRALTARTGVSMPRFAGMPSALKRTYLAPALTVALAVVAAVVMTRMLEDPSYALLGLIVGPALGLSLKWQARRCREVARALTEAEGLDR